MPNDTDTTVESAPRAAKAAPRFYVITRGSYVERDGRIQPGELHRNLLFNSAADAWRELDPHHGRRARLYWVANGYGVRLARWDERERIRLESETPAASSYTAPVWNGERWWRRFRSGAGALHFAHAAEGTPGNIAFTETPEKGERDIQTSMKAGRYLKRFLGGELTDKQIAFFAEWQRRGVKPGLDWVQKAPLRFARTPDEIEDVYARGPSSCMQSESCVRVYGAGDLAIAYLERPDSDDASGPEVIARALVWPERKALGRVYPNTGDWSRDEFTDESTAEAAYAELERRLKEDGYESFYERSGVFNGARLLVEEDGDGYVMPYIDKLTTSGPHKGADGRLYWTLSDNGEYRPDRNDGRFELPAWGSCDRCGSTLDSEDDATTVYERHGAHGPQYAESWCCGCVDRYSFTCDATDEHFNSRTTSAATVLTGARNSESWVAGWTESHAFFCDYLSAYVASERDSERFPGFPDWMDDDSDAHPELLDSDDDDAAEAAAAETSEEVA